MLIVCVSSSIVYPQEVGNRCMLPISGKPGVCKLMTQCPSAIEAKKVGINPVLCSYYFNEAIVCCKDETIENRFGNQQHQPWDSPFIFPDSVGFPTNNRPARAKQQCMEYRKLLVSTVQAIPLVTNPKPITAEVAKCDKNSLPLIVGGTPAQPGEFPHMALLGYANGNTIQWNCGGTLISDRYVLTAGHCTRTRYGNVRKIRLGELNLERNDDGAEPQDFDVEQSITHPLYKQPKKYNDIALIRLSTAVEFNRFIRPACLWTKFPIKHNKTIATGWGNTEFGGAKSDGLLKVALDIIDNNYCNSFYQDIRRILPQGITNSMMCAGILQGGKDTCQGDSGGPIQITSHENPCLFYIVGVTSFGKSCGSANSPAVYTRVSEYLNWIEDIVWP